MHCVSPNSFSLTNARSIWAIWVIALCLWSTQVYAEPPEQQQQVARILVERCLACHGPNKQEGGYRVDSFERLRKPGDSGAKAIVPGRVDQSELFKRLITDDVDARMPAGAVALTATQIAAFEKWIGEGAIGDAAYESKAIATWSRGSNKPHAPECYPSALPITALALAEHGDQISLWTSGYGEALQWTLAESENQLTQRLPTAGVHVSDIDLSADDRWMAIASGTPGTQGFIELFERNEKGYRLVWAHSCQDLPADLEISPDGQHVAVGHSDGTLMIVDVTSETTKELSTRLLSPHADAILAVSWSVKGDRLITGSRERTAKIFDASKWQLVANYDRHERAVGGVAYIDRYPVSLDETGKLRLWSGDDSDRTLAERDNQARFLEHVVIASDRVWFAMGANLRSFEIERKTVDDGKDEAGKPKQKTTTRWKATDDLPSQGDGWLLSIDANSKFIAAGNESGQVIVWKLGEKQTPHQFLAKP